MAETGNWKLPLMVTAQAQKEVTHNEALVLIDALLAGVVVGGPLDTPPVSPLAGQCWIVGQNPIDDWEQKASKLAVWTDGGWRFLPSQPNMQIRRQLDGAMMSFDGSVWQQPALISVPVGGDTIDTEARLVLGGLIQLLHGHGLLNAA